MTHMICAECHHIGNPNTKKRGSLRTELFMWSLFPLGIPYTLWRMAGKINICAECGSDFMVKDTSLLGMQILTNIEQNVPSRKRVTSKDFQRFMEQANRVDLQATIAPAPSATTHIPDTQTLELPAAPTPPKPLEKPAPPSKTKPSSNAAQW